jgi:hypothetical protein
MKKSINPGIGNLTSREVWLVCKGFREAYGQGHNDTVESCYNAECEMYDDGAMDWLMGDAADGVIVADVLSKDAPGIHWDIAFNEVLINRIKDLETECGKLTSELNAARERLT